MSRQKFRLAAVILLLIGMLAFTGCARLEMNYAIQEDGTVDASYVFSVESKEDVPADIKDLMDAAMTQAADNGFSLTPYEKDGYTGFKAAKTMEKTDLRKAGDELLGFSKPPAIFSEFYWYFNPGVFRNRYQMTLNMNLENIIDTASLDQLPSDMKEKALKAIEDSVVTVNFTLPGKAERTNAHETKYTPGKSITKYTWKVKPGQIETLHIEAVLEKDRTRNQVVWAAVITITLILLAVCFFVLRRLRNKKLK